MPRPHDGSGPAPPPRAGRAPARCGRNRSGWSTTSSTSPRPGADGGVDRHSRSSRKRGRPASMARVATAVLDQVPVHDLGAEAVHPGRDLDGRDVTPPPAGDHQSCAQVRKEIVEVLLVVRNAAVPQPATPWSRHDPGASRSGPRCREWTPITARSPKRFRNQVLQFGLRRSLLYSCAIWPQQPRVAPPTLSVLAAIELRPGRCHTQLSSKRGVIVSMSPALNAA